MIATAEGVRTPSDRDLILSSLERPERFETVFARHGATIYRYLRRRVGEDLAEELVAETFARAFRARGRFDPRGEWALPWLYGIAANLLRMHRRTEERRLGSSLDAVALGPALAEALAGLPPGQREVLLLHAWADLAHDEIAAALGISTATVRSHLHRARARVAERLTPFGNEGDEDPRARAR